VTAGGPDELRKHQETKQQKKAAKAVHDAVERLAAREVTCVPGDAYDRDRWMLPDGLRKDLDALHQETKQQKKAAKQQQKAAKQQQKKIKEKAKKTHVCPCGKGFKTASSLQQHQEHRKSCRARRARREAANSEELEAKAEVLARIIETNPKPVELSKLLGSAWGKLADPPTAGPPEAAGAEAAVSEGEADASAELEAQTNSELGRQTANLKAARDLEEDLAPPSKRTAAERAAAAVSARVGVPPPPPSAAGLPSGLVRWEVDGRVEYRVCQR